MSSLTLSLSLSTVQACLWKSLSKILSPFLTISLQKPGYYEPKGEGEQ